MTTSDIDRWVLCQRCGIEYMRLGLFAPPHECRRTSDGKRMLLICTRDGGTLVADAERFAVDDDDKWWHDGSRHGGDIVCHGPFYIEYAECRCCPLTNGGRGHCGHTDCCWEAGSTVTRKGEQVPK